MTSANAPASPPSHPAPRMPLLSNPRAMAALLLMPLFFAVNLIVGRAAVESTSPWALAFWRWFLATAILLPFAANALWRQRDVLRAHWVEIAVLGGLVTLVAGGNVYLSLQHTSATNANLIYTTATIMIVVMDAMLARKALPPLQLAGAIAGFVGIALITVQGDPWRLIELEFNIGDLGILVAAVGWAAYSLMLRRHSLDSLGAVPAFTIIALAGVILVAPFMLVEAAQGGHAPEGWRGWGAVVLLATFPSVGAFTLYQYAIRVAGAPVTANFLYLMPVYGVAMAVLLLGEELHLYHLVGFVLILGGVVLATRPTR